MAVAVSSDFIEVNDMDDLWSNIVYNTYSSLYSVAVTVFDDEVYIYNIITDRWKRFKSGDIEETMFSQRLSFINLYQHSETNRLEQFSRPFYILTDLNCEKCRISLEEIGPNDIYFGYHPHMSERYCVCYKKPKIFLFDLKQSRTAIAIDFCSRHCPDNRAILNVGIDKKGRCMYFLSENVKEFYTFDLSTFRWNKFFIEESPSLEIDLFTIIALRQAGDVLYVFSKLYLIDISDLSFSSKVTHIGPPERFKKGNLFRFIALSIRSLRWYEHYFFIEESLEISLYFLSEDGSLFLRVKDKDRYRLLRWRYSLNISSLRDLSAQTVFKNLSTIDGLSFQDKFKSLELSLPKSILERYR
jgi:hypothetical protein